MKYFLLLSFLLIASAKKHKLALNLEVGETYSMTYEKNNYSVMKGGGPMFNYDHQLAMDIIGGMDFRVLAKNEEFYTIKCSYKKTTMDLRLEGADSEEGVEEFKVMLKGINILLARLEGLEFDVELYRNGLLKEVRGLEELINNLDNEENDLPSASTSKLVEMIQPVLGEKSFKNDLELITNIFPETTIETGDSWSKQHFSEPGHNVPFNTRFTLSEVSQDYMIVRGDLKVLPESDHSNENRKSKSTYDGGGSITMTLDPDSGWIMEVTSNYLINGERIMNYGYSGHENNDYTIYFKINQSTKIQN